MSQIDTRDEKDVGLTVHNGQAFDLSRRVVLDIEPFRKSVLQQVGRGSRIASFFGRSDGERILLECVLADDASGALNVLAAEANNEFSSLTPDCPQANWFEREIHEQTGLRLLGHPWLKPIRFTGRDGAGAGATVGVTDFFRMDGDAVHEVAVGPVHAGVIEPGHFRFQCLGETVHHLEISLGYQHRGVERAILAGSETRIPHYLETLAGDTTIGHSIAYCRAMESLTGLRPSPRAQAIRGIAAELERLANHIGDLGALAGDVGFLPTMNYCGRIRGDVLNLTATICGNRFGRGLLIPGAVRYDIEPARSQRMLTALASIESDARNAIELMFDTPSMLARLDGTGVVSAEVAGQVGLVGPAVRACGLTCDARVQHAYGIYRFASLPVSTWHSGDCFARAYVRWLEAQRSFNFVRDLLQSLPAGGLEPDGVAGTTGMPGLAAHRMVVTLVEGWRGEICHTVATDEAGRIARYKIVDPSFHNWFGLAVAMRDQPISDFPLCNKSFNLSYCGHDL